MIKSSNPKERLTMNPIFPKNANNDYRFPKFLYYIFIVFTIVTAARSLAHIFLPDGGANLIASIITFTGDPNPNLVIYFIFSYWGLSQLLMAGIYVVVIIKYRNLIPLMYAFIFFEYLFRFLIGQFLKPLSEDYFAHIAPGAVGNYIMIPLALVLLLLCLFLHQKEKALKT